MVAMYVVWAAMHMQEVISVVLASSLPYVTGLAGFLLRSGLAGSPSLFASSNETKREDAAPHVQWTRQPNVSSKSSTSSLDPTPATSLVKN
ncbi:hypothetical protein DFH11DRAFT_1615353 [Phellopilus nigrolimitatus]|nr:hypothetical protein DFH11DRAFT_1615353 [Phellopilus nigrolimitatus]